MKPNTVSPVNGSSVNHPLIGCWRRISPEEGAIKKPCELTLSSSSVYLCCSELSNIINLTTLVIWISGVDPSHTIYTSAAILITLCLISK